MNAYHYPAKIISYNAKERTANVSISGLTDGLDEGLKALLAYPIGDDDLDTERELLAGTDVWVFFENGDQHAPVVAFYRSHGTGRAVVNCRRIRQENIELLARRNLTLTAGDVASITAKTINLVAEKINIDGDITHNGNQNTTGTITGTNDVVGGGKSLKSHNHGGVRTGTSSTSSPN